MTKRTRYVVIGSLAVLAAGLGTGLIAYYVGFQLTGADAAGDLRYVPKDATVVTSIDVRAVMASPLRERLRRVLPNGIDRENTIRDLTGVDIERDVQHATGFVVPSADGSDAQASAGMMLVRGTFDEAKIESLMRDRGAREEDYKGHRVFTTTPRAAAPESGSGGVPILPFGRTRSEDLSVSFVEPGVAAIGTPAVVRRAIDLKRGDGESVADDEEIMRRLGDLEPSTIWAAGRLTSTGGGASLPPAAERFSQQLNAIQWLSISLNVGTDVDGTIRAEARDEASAGELRDVIRGLMAFGRLQQGSNQNLGAVFDSLQLSGTGSTIAITFRVPSTVLDQLGTAPALPMPNPR
jgi:hypothetical protein